MQYAVLQGNYVDLVTGIAPVAMQDLKAKAGEIGGCQRFALTACIVVPGHKLSLA
jgi:hypothetical protein